MKQTKLKIGLDYHGVIDTDPEYFAEFVADVHSKGHQIYIISGAPRLALQPILKHNDIKADFIFSVLDYCTALGLMVYCDSVIKIDDCAWDKAKADFCRYNHIDLHIDDSWQYCNHFTTFCCRYNQDKRLCYNHNSPKINFNCPPVDAVIQIERLLADI